MLKRTITRSLAFVAALGVGRSAACLWLAALFFRHVMDRGGVALAAALAKHVPAGVVARLNERYDPGGTGALLDVYYPAAIEKTERSLPTIVWVHGGGFIAGRKDLIANYLKILAAAGYTTVGIDYSLAPGAIYPTPVRQVNAALAYLQKNAQRLHVDPTVLFLAGDSAGAQIAAQAAMVISDPSYAKAIEIAPAIVRAQLRGVILLCGVYDPFLLDYGPSGSLLFKTAMWSYLGTRDVANDPRVKQFSVVRNVTAEFPPMFISVGTDDALAPHSPLLAETAAKLGIPVDSLFFASDHTPPLPHEYQFNLDSDAGKLAFERILKFLKGRSG